MKLLSLDPGGTTGFAIRDSEVIRGGQLAWDEHHRHLWDLLDFERPDAVVCEEFQYQIRRNQGVDMPGIVLVSKEYIGVAKIWCDLRGKVYHEQKLSSLKFWDDDKLKKIGLYEPGKPHRNDAVRHLLYYITFTLEDQSYVMKLR
jgi:hypothetical protein